MMLPISSDVAQGVLAWLGAATLKSSLVLALAFVAARWRGTSAATRHAIWAAGVATAVAIPVAQLVLPSWEVGVLPAAAATEWSAELPSLPSVDPIVNSADAHPTVARTIPSTARVAEIAAGDRSTALPIVDEPVAWIIDPDATTAAGAAERFPLGLPLLALSIWLLGALIVLLPWVLGVRRRTTLWHRASAEISDGWKNAWRYIPTSVDRDIRIRTSDLTTVPMTWGIVAPVILTPRAPHWTAAERRAALLHELAHIARFDTVWQGISRLVLAVFWFNPLAWVADAMMRAEGERACDDAVLRAGTRASEYAQQLLEVLRASAEQGMHPVAVMSMARRSGMAERLRALLDAGQKRGRLPRRLGLSLVAVSGAVAVPVGRLTPVPMPAVAQTMPVVVSSQRIQVTPAPVAESASHSIASTMNQTLATVPLADAQATLGDSGAGPSQRFTSAFGLSLSRALGQTPGVRNLLSEAQARTALGALGKLCTG